MYHRWDFSIYYADRFFWRRAEITSNDLPWPVRLGDDSRGVSSFGLDFLEFAELFVILYDFHTLRPGTNPRSAKSLIGRHRLPTPEPPRSQSTSIVGIVPYRAPADGGFDMLY